MSSIATSVTFQGASKETLSGKLHVPAGRPRAWALFAHCFTCSKDLRAAVRIAEAMAERGVGVLRFDFTGLGQSGGEFADTTLSSNISDLEAAAEFLAQTQSAPQILVGHSLGGAAVLSAARALDKVRAVATINAPADAEHVTRLFASSRDEIDERGEAEVEIAGTRFRIKDSFVRDLEQHAILDALPGMRKAVLFCHAPGDVIVDVENARRLFEAAKHPKSFVSLDDADHLLSRPADAAYAGALIAAWASRYVEVDADASAEEDIENQVVVRGGAAAFAQDIRSGHHRLRADEPVSSGGTDTGPGPYDLLLAALGSCSSMTMKLYAARKGWPLEGVIITLDHERRHVDDCRGCEGDTRRLDHIDKDIALEGDLSGEQRDRLIEIADKCPVHRTLQSEIRITTTRADHRD